VNGVCPITENDIMRILNNISKYDGHLISLPEEAWETSICQWMCGYWGVLIDLFTIEEGISDLVLVVRVYENKLSYSFEIMSVHVP